jgi:hypothetical protein
VRAYLILAVAVTPGGTTSHCEGIAGWSMGVECQGEGVTFVLEALAGGVHTRQDFAFKAKWRQTRLLSQSKSRMRGKQMMRYEP